MLLATSMSYLADPTGHFSPLDLSALEAWYRGDTITGSDGDVQSAWADSTGNGWTASLTAGTGPTLQVAEINGLNAVLFNAADVGKLTMSSSLLSGAASCAMMAVVKRTNDPAATQAQAGGILDGFTNDTSGLRASHYVWTDGVIYEHFGMGTRATTGNPTPALTSPRVYGVTASTSNFKTYIDGTQFFSDGFNTVNTGAVTRRIGHSDGNLGFNYFHGLIAEICIFDATLATSDRQKMEGYLAWKWGIQANLPAGHPYLAAPP